MNIECANCGRLTNTATSDWMEPQREDGRAHRCYIAIVNGQSIRGCSKYSETREQCYLRKVPNKKES